jgi:hypothetical protein
MGPEILSERRMSADIPRGTRSRHAQERSSAERTDSLNLMGGPRSSQWAETIHARCRAQLFEASLGESATASRCLRGGVDLLTRDFAANAEQRSPVAGKPRFPYLSRFARFARAPSAVRRLPDPSLDSAVSRPLACHPIEQHVASVDPRPDRASICRRSDKAMEDGPGQQDGAADLEP